MAQIRIDKKKAVNKWSPVLENMGVAGERVEWMSEMAEFHSINENAYANANVAGMGGVVSPQPSGLPGQTLAGGTDGSGDVGQNLLPVAMKIAAMNPISVDESTVPQDVIDRELSVGRELAIQEGKPEEMADKIAQGRLKKFYKETTLLNQMFVRDNKKTVKQFLADTNPDLTVTDFKRISLSI